jgi:hypothetical protein
VPVVDETGRPVSHTPEFLSRLYDEQLAGLTARAPDQETAERYQRARVESEAMIVEGRFDPV